MTVIRGSEIYVSRRVSTALRLAAGLNLGSEDQVADALAEQFLTERLETQFPGIFDVVDQCNAAFDLARAENKRLCDEWEKKIKQQTP